VFLSTGLLNTVQVYSLQRSQFQTPIQTDQTPLAMAVSRDSRFLYVACYDNSLLDVIDLNTLVVSARVNLPAKPEALAVGKDGRVLISTSGGGTNSTSNTLVVYDPASGVLTALAFTPPAAAPAVFPAPLNRPFLSMKSQLVATKDGAYIAGVNIGLTNQATVYLYESASATILASRTVNNSAITVAISDDGTRIVSGLNLFDATTFQVLAQHSPINATYPLIPTSSFLPATVLPSNQGGHVFAHDGSAVYTGLNSSSNNPMQLMVSDPDNLLITQGFQIPENLAGKMVLSADGANIYALSDSGFTILPIGTISQSPLAVPASGALLLTRDQCGAFATGSSATLTVNNAGRNRITAAAQLFAFTGGAAATAPLTRAGATSTGAQITFSFNASLTRGLGTITPPHDFSITSPEAINIPNHVRVYENVRDSDSRGTILPLPTGNTTTAPFPDMLYDQTRQRIYIANFGLNRLEVFDTRKLQFLTPVKVGQSPVSLAMTPDAGTLYVANSGGESISIIDLDKLVSTGLVAFPPIPVFSTQVVTTPSVIVTSLSGPMVLLTNGTSVAGSLWKIVGNALAPRTPSKIIGVNTQGAQNPIPLPSSLASTPGGEYILLVTGAGNAYLYDASVDDFIASRTLGVAASGYSGPIGAGPKGQFFVVNGSLLNQSLVPTRTPVGLVAAVGVGTNNYAIFSPPAAAAANTLPATAPTVQIIDGNTGNPTLTVPALEGPFTQAVTGRATPVGGRMMAIDSANTNVYALTISGLSIVPLAPVAPADRPVPANRGAVNLGSYQTNLAPNSLMSIFGSNLGASEVAAGAPLPTVLGGTCVTLNNTPLPLFMVSPGQINAQIPPNLAAGTYPLVVRSLTKSAAGTSQNITISKYAPAVLVAPNGQIALFHQDGSYVNTDNPANRDEPLAMYAVGMGATKGGPVTAGNVSPTSPLAETDGVDVFFGDPDLKQSAVIVDFSGLVPNFIGLYQLNLRVPGFHGKGDALPVTLRMGTIDSPTTGPVVPYVAVN
jgi:uncharacterized protein (TIGR03437 family)